MTYFRTALKWLLRALSALALLLLVCALAIAGVAFFERGACTAKPFEVNTVEAAAHQKEREAIPGYVREKKTTFLTFPEWYIVYSARELGSHLASKKSPSDFPYFVSIARFWCSYGILSKGAGEYEKVTFSDHLLLSVIGSSYSMEYLLKGVYENTIGRITWRFGGPSPEDAFYAAFTDDYAKFLDEIPWYDYPFGAKLGALWRSPSECPKSLRSCERRVVYAIELALKAGYGRLIGGGTKATYAPAKETVMVYVFGNTIALEKDPDVKILKRFDDETEVIEVPRYQAFTEIAQRLAAQGYPMLDIAGHSNVLISVFVPREEKLKPIGQTVMEMQTVDGRTRRLILIDVNTLSDYLNALKLVEGYALEHIYDY